MEIEARIEARSLLLSKVGRLRERRRTTRTKKTAKDEEDGEGRRGRRRTKRTAKDEEDGEGRRGRRRTGAMTVARTGARKTNCSIKRSYYCRRE